MLHIEILEIKAESRSMKIAIYNNELKRENDCKIKSLLTLYFTTEGSIDISSGGNTLKLDYAILIEVNKNNLLKILKSHSRKLKSLSAGLECLTN